MDKDKVEIIRYIEKCPKCSYPTSALKYLKSAQDNWKSQGYLSGLKKAVEVARNYGCNANRDVDDEFLCGEEIADKLESLIKEIK